MTSQLQPIPCDPHTALLLIDNQVGFLHPTYWGSSRSTPSYESNLTALINAFRSPKAPEGRTSSPLVINVQHLSKTFSSPLHPDYIGSPDSNFAGQHGSDFLPFAKPDEGEPIVIKSVNSAFIGTGLEKLLRENEITTLVITGITTDHCVSTTTRMAANLGVVNYDDKKVGFNPFTLGFDVQLY